MKGSPLGRGATVAKAASACRPAMWADRKDTTVSAPAKVRSAVALAMSANAQLACREEHGALDSLTPSSCSPP